MQPSNVQDGEDSVLHDVCTDPQKELNKAEWIDGGLSLSCKGFFSPLKDWEDWKFNLVYPRFILECNMYCKQLS